MNQQEVWKDVKNYKGIYQVSNLGRVKSLDRISIGRHGETKLKGGSYPLDYKYDNIGYLVGMSVPPVMTAQIASRIYEQWISKF